MSGLLAIPHDRIVTLYVIFVMMCDGSVMTLRSTADYQQSVQVITLEFSIQGALTDAQCFCDESAVVMVLLQQR